MQPLRLFTLGTLRLEHGDEELLARRRNQLVLLAYLADRSPRAVRRAELSTLLWGERDEQRARASLRQALSKLRQAVGSGLETGPDEIRLTEGAVTTDVDQMESDLEAGRLEAAVEHWGGEFLPGADEIGTESLRSWIDAERERLRRRYCGALDQLFRNAEKGADWESAAEWARRWVEADQFSEVAHSRLIRALRLKGAAEEADGVYAIFVARLREEFEREPSPGFLQLAESSPKDSAPKPRVLRTSSTALFTPDLVGRAEEFAELTAVWESVRGDGDSSRRRGAVVLVEGELGIGKSRLCEEFLRWNALSGEGAFVLRARAYPVEPARAWMNARHLLDGLDSAPGLSGAPDDALAAVSRLVPSLRERYPRLPPAEGVELPLVEALARVLEDVASEAPVVLFLDDLPAADSSTRKLLVELASYPPPGVLILLTGRTEAVGAESALEPFHNVDEVRRIRLEPLTLSYIESLLASMVALQTGERRSLAQKLYEEANGNPFYTVALVSALADSEQLAPDPTGVWRVSPPPEGGQLPLPADIQEAVRTRLKHLGVAARDVLGAAAVLQPPIDASTLETMSGLPPDQFAEAVEELLARRLLSEGASPDGGFEFTHDLIARVTYRLLSPPRRQALHRTAYRTLSRLGGTGDGARERLRYHRERAGRFRGSARRRAIAVAAALLVLIAAAVVIYGGRETGTHAASAADGAAPRLAVLSLHNLTRDTVDAYLAHGLTEEIASRLSMLDRLRVKSPDVGVPLPQGYRPDPVALGDSLDVDYLLEGSLRRAGELLRVSMRLTNTVNGFRVWAGTYDVASVDILSVQDTIATQIAMRIAGELLPEDRIAIERRMTDDAEAYDHFLRGNYHLARRTPESVLRGIEEYQSAVAIDSSFSSALAREAYGYALFLDWGWTFPGASAEELLARGLLITESILQRDSTSADAWMARGYLFVMRDPLRHSGAAEAFARSIALNPGNAEVHHQLGQTLMATGRLDDASAAYRRALEIEPQRAMTLVPLAAIKLRQGDLDKARTLSDSAVAADPSVPYAYTARGLQALGRGDAAAARRDAETALALDRTYPLPARAVLAGALAAAGDSAAARREVEACVALLADEARPSPTEMLFLGAAMLALGDRESTLDLIERTRPRSAWIWFYLQDSHYDVIRDHPRFEGIMRQVRPAPEHAAG